MSQIINNPTIPHLSEINNGLSSGKMFRIQGSTSSTSERFNINLQCGPNTSPRDDIALHLSVRLTEGYIARNSVNNQIWGEEQGQGFNPIKIGQPFEILILTDHSNYKIAINGIHFCEFPFRIPINRVTHLTIDGDVSINVISIDVITLPQNTGVTAATATPQAVGPVPGYGPMHSYSGLPPMGSYGPPLMGAGPSGPPIMGAGPYGPPPMGAGPYGPYGLPPPPEHRVEGDKSGSGLESFLGQAGAAIAGAFGSAVLQGALTGKQGQHQPTPPPPPQQQPFAGGNGGQSVGGLGSIGSFLTNTLADTLIKQVKKE